MILCSQKIRNFMKASDLHLLELLEIDAERGSIRFKDRRMLLWDADAFGSLRKELIDSLGFKQARAILKRFGFANGYRDARMTENLLHWDSDKEWWLTCPRLQSHEGKVQPKVGTVKVDREAKEFAMEVTWDNSYEAEQHLRIFGETDSPVCWTLAGVASGFATALMGEECIVVETECIAMGHAFCKVSGKTRRAWGEKGAEVAQDYQAQPLASELDDRERELGKLQHALAKRERELAANSSSSATPQAAELVSCSLQMEKVLKLCETVAKVDSTALITGEPGVAKIEIAEFIHSQSELRDGPFQMLNCGALPETLLESELFGHVEGAFTGAGRDKLGLFETTRGGTLLLHEVSEMSPTIQVKLLRALQEQEIWPVGASEPRPISLRVLTSTSQDLERLTQEGKFRMNLFYLLSVVVIDVPPLRARSEDIVPLARAFIRSTCQKNNLPPKSLTSEAAEALVEHSWPGNVRELRNAIERAVVLGGTKNKIERADLSANIRSVSANVANVRYDQVITIAELARRSVLEVLARYQGNRTRTAKALGIGANTLWRKLKAWGVPSARGDF